ncbi:hypothetical protein DPMN_030996 [Dreissena polymorpha]|uniref:Uncharacterized protein n=1 Tax=Dreissena polymorpha TaxID=45954 RepID=A0A9D4M1D7_DREPO|nr:hypothetical protein DPMN_030996 [Dreissena polymorpha]
MVWTKFHDDWAKMKKTPPLGGHETNYLTKFREDWAKNVSYRLFSCCHYIHIEKTALPPGGNENDPPAGGQVFLLIRTIFKLNHCIQETKVLTKYHEDWAKNVSSRLFTCFQYIHIEKTAPPPGGHVFPPVLTIYELAKMKKTPLDGHVFYRFEPFSNATVVFKNVSSRLFTCFHYIHIEKTAPYPGGHAKNVTSREKDPPGGHVFLPTRTIFELNRGIRETNVLTKFNEDWAKNVSSRLFTCKNVTSRVFTSFFYYINIRKKTSPGGHVFLPIHTIFKLKRRIKETNVLTKFHEYLTKNVTSRVFTCFHYIHIEKTAPPPGGHVFSPIWTIFELVRDINETNGLTKFRDDWAKIVTSRVFTRNTAPPPGGHVLQWTKTIFELNQHIIKTNILTKLHENWASNVILHFELSRGIIGTHVLTKFYEDRTINVASRVFTWQMLTTDTRQTKGDHKSSP